MLFSCVKAKQGISSQVHTRTVAPHLTMPSSTCSCTHALQRLACAHTKQVVQRQAVVSCTQTRRTIRPEGKVEPASHRHRPAEQHHNQRIPRQLHTWMALQDLFIRAGAVLLLVSQLGSSNIRKCASQGRRRDFHWAWYVCNVNVKTSQSRYIIRLSNIAVRLVVVVAT